MVASKNFDAEEDCKALKKAMKGFGQSTIIPPLHPTTAPYHPLIQPLHYDTFSGTNEDEITRVLAHRSSVQRQELVQRFKTMYGQVSLWKFDSFRANSSASGCLLSDVGVLWGGELRRLACA